LQWRVEPTKRKGPILIRRSGLLQAQERLFAFLFRGFFLRFGLLFFRSFFFFFFDLFFFLLFFRLFLRFFFRLFFCFFFALFYLFPFFLLFGSYLFENFLGFRDGLFLFLLGMCKGDQFHEGEGGCISLPPSQFENPGITSCPVFKFWGDFIEEFLHGPFIPEEGKSPSSGVQGSLFP